MPEGTSSLTVDVDNGGFADGRVVPGTHAGAGTCDEWVANDFVFFRLLCDGRVWIDWGSTFDSEESFALWREVQLEIPRVRDLARVELRGRVGGPVCESGLRQGLV